jgi:hypothetical protein
MDVSDAGGEGTNGEWASGLTDRRLQGETDGCKEQRSSGDEKALAFGAKQVSKEASGTEITACNTLCSSG